MTFCLSQLCSSGLAYTYYSFLDIQSLLLVLSSQSIPGSFSLNFLPCPLSQPLANLLFLCLSFSMLFEKFSSKTINISVSFNSVLKAFLGKYNVTHFPDGEAKAQMGVMTQSRTLIMSSIFKKLMEMCIRKN